MLTLPQKLNDIFLFYLWVYNTDSQKRRLLFVVATKIFFYSLNGARTRKGVRFSKKTHSVFESLKTLEFKVIFELLDFE